MKATFTRFSPFVGLLPVLSLLLLYILSRLQGISTMPPFIDEFLHIQWAQDVYQGHIFTGAANGRLLALWWLSLFQLSGDHLLWITRTVTVLFNLIGVAVIYNLGRTLFSKWAGLLAAVIYVLAPFTFFHERLGLADSYVATLGALSLWFGVRFVRRHKAIDAILTGLILTAAILVKATGLMFIFVPAIVFLTLIPWSRWRQVLQGNLLAYGTFLISFGPFFLFLRWRGWSYFGVAVSVVGTDNPNGFFDRFINNIKIAWTIDVAYLSIGLLGLYALLVVYLLLKRGRLGLVLSLTTLVPLGAMLAFATKVSGRYILIHVPLLTLGLGIGLAVIITDLRQRGGVLKIMAVPLVAGILLVWALLFALPVQELARNDPASLNLPGDDIVEYVQGDSSGFTLDRTAQYFLEIASQTTKAVHVVGLLANCGGLGLLIPEHHGVTLDCPYITYTGSNQPALAGLVNQLAGSDAPFDLWVVSENSPYISLDGITAPYQKVITFDRPGNLSHVSLYHIAKTN